MRMTFLIIGSHYTRRAIGHLVGNLFTKWPSLYNFFKCLDLVSETAK